MCKNAFKQLFTGKDNQTQDLVRWLGALAFVVGLGLQVYAVIAVKAFSLVEFGSGVGFMLGGLGVSIKVKETTEPDEK